MNQIIVTTKEELISLITEVFRAELSNIKPQQEKENPFITRFEAAKLLGISLPTLRTYSVIGAIPTYAIGSRIRYKRSEIIAAVVLLSDSSYIKNKKVLHSLHGKGENTDTTETPIDKR